MSQQFYELRNSLEANKYSNEIVLTVRDDDWVKSKMYFPTINIAYREYIDTIIYYDSNSLNKKKQYWFQAHKNYSNFFNPLSSYCNAHFSEDATNSFVNKFLVLHGFFRNTTKEFKNRKNSNKIIEKMMAKTNTVVNQKYFLKILTILSNNQFAANFDLLFSDFTKTIK
jgi:hypothetical protein